MKLAETELIREIVSEAEWLVARKDLLAREDPAGNVFGIIEPDEKAI